MKLSVGLGARCPEDECLSVAAPTEFYGTPRLVVEPAAPAVVSAEPSMVLGFAASLGLGLLIGAALIYRFSARVERLRDRHRAAAELRNALAPVIAGFREAEQANNLAPLTAALQGHGGNIQARIDLLSGGRAERIHARFEQLEKLGRADPAAPSATDFNSIRWTLSRLLVNSYL